MNINSYNPANNELLGQIKVTSTNEIENIVNNSKQAFESWGYLTLDERLSYISEVYEKIKSKKEELSKLITS